jgi:hypothetical protein
LEPTVASNYNLEKDHNILIQTSKKWVGKWIKDGNGESCALLISSDGSWYFMNNYTGKDAEGFYTISGNTLRLGRELSAQEKMVYYGKTDILYFTCTLSGSGSSLQISPQWNQAAMLSGGIITLRKQ